MVKVHKLSNGITVVLEQMQYLKSVSFGVWIKAGSAYENVENNGISHVIEHMLFQGTEKRTAKKLAEDIAAVGGNLNAYTSKEYTCFYVTTLEEYLPDSIDLIQDMLNHSLFDRKALDKEKRIIMDEIDMYEDSPEDLVQETLQMQIWENHPLGYYISGMKEIVNKMTREELMAFHENFYTAENMVISVAGSFKEECLMEELEKGFGCVKCSKKKNLLTRPDYKKVICEKKKEIEQVHMVLAYDSVSLDSEDRYAVTLFNGILGDSSDSRLFMKIRDELGLTYSIFSFCSSYKEAGLLNIYAAVHPKQLEQVYIEIQNILEEIRVHGVTKKELEQTKVQMKTELIIGSESTRSRMGSNGQCIINRGEVISLETTIQRINAVTEEDIKGYAKQYLKHTEESFSVVGNWNKNFWSNL